MPATSKAQQQAAGIAYAARTGRFPKSRLRGASASMFKMGKESLKHFASTKSKGLPKRKKRGRKRNARAAFLRKEMLKHD